MLILLSVAGSPSGSWTDGGANKWTFLSSSDNNSGGAQHGTNICYKVMEAGDRWPGGGGTNVNNINWNGSNRYSVCAVCIQPDAGQTFTGAEIGTAASPTINTTAFTTHLPPAYAAGSDTGLSLLFTGARAFSNGATAIATTPPTDWTEPANGDSSTASGTNANSRQVATSVSTRADQTGTITPGFETVVGGVANGATTANVYHLLIKGLGGGGEPPAPFDASRFMPFFV